MTNITKPHPHADFISEAAKDTSRRIIGTSFDTTCVDCSLGMVVQADERWKFMFADTVKPMIVSTLTNDDLEKLAPNLWGNQHAHYTGIRKVADAAALKERANIIYFIKHFQWRTDTLSNLPLQNFAIRDYILQISDILQAGDYLG